MNRWITSHRQLMCEVGVQSTQLSVALIGIVSVAMPGSVRTTTLFASFALFGAGIGIIIFARFNKELEANGWDRKFFGLIAGYVTVIIGGVAIANMPSDSSLGLLSVVLLMTVAYILGWLWGKVALADIDSDASEQS